MLLLLFFSENESEGLKNSKLSHLSALLEKEKKRTESLNETSKEKTLLLQRQIQLYTSVNVPVNTMKIQIQNDFFFHAYLMWFFSFFHCQELTKCVQLLQSLVLDHRLKIQTDLDRKKLEYFEGKCELVLQKIKLVDLLTWLSTVNNESMSRHAVIRDLYVLLLSIIYYLFSYWFIW